MITLLQLETFIELYYCDSFQQTAQNLNTTQPTISKRIKELEYQLGVILMNRKTNVGGISLTPEGQTILHYAEKMIRNRNQLLTSLVEPSQNCSEIRIGCSETLVYINLSKRIKLFNTQYPDISLNIKINSTDQLSKMLLGGEIDTALMIGPIYDKQIITTPIQTCEMRWYSGKSLDEDFMPLDKLCQQYAIITFGTDTPPYKNLLHLLAKFQISQSNIHSCTSLHSIIEMTKENIGIGLLPKEVAQSYVEQGILHQVNTEQCDPLHFYGTYLRSNKKALYLAQFIQS